MSKNFQAFLKLNVKGLENQYVIIVNGKIVDKGFDIEKMLARARKNIPKPHLLLPRFLTGGRWFYDTIDFKKHRARKIRR